MLKIIFLLIAIIGPCAYGVECVTECYELGKERFLGQCFNTANCLEHALTEDGLRCVMIRQYYEYEPIDCDSVKWQHSNDTLDCHNAPVKLGNIK